MRLRAVRGGCKAVRRWGEQRKGRLLGLRSSGESREMVEIEGCEVVGEGCEEQGREQESVGS